MKDAADDDHRVCPHDVNYLVAAELPEMIGANDRVFVTAPDIVHARFEFNDVVDMRLICNRPVHSTTNATQRKFPARVAAGQLLERRDHPICIEASIRKVDIPVDAKFHLSALLRCRRVDSCGTQALEMILTLIRIHNMNRLVATLEPISYEWE